MVEESMKTRLQILSLLLSSLFVIFSSGVFAAVNPTDYISLNKFYSLVPEGPDGLPVYEYYSFTNDSDTYHGYIGQFRAFIPPGTVLLDLNIIETGKQMAVARHMFPPTGLPDVPPKGYTPDNYFTLDELIAADCWVTENSQDSLYLASDGFTPPLEENKAGWLYVKVGGGQYSAIYDTHFSVRVKSVVYNAWWKSAIKDAAGWNQYVEGVKTYVDPMNPPTQAVLSVTPSSQDVLQEAGTASFNVTNTGTGTMNWTAAVTSGGSWLSIASGGSGSDTGTIICAYGANTDTVSRTGTIRVTADGSTGSPVDVTVTQAPMQRENCTATIAIEDGDLMLHIPYLTYNITVGPLSLLLDFVYEFDPSEIRFKLTNAGIFENSSFSCAASTLSSDDKIHIPDLVLSPGGTTHYWMDLDYSPNLSSDEAIYFLVTDAGPVAN